MTSSPAAPRALVWVPADQLLVQHPALHAAAQVYGQDNVRVVLVWAATRLRRLPYQRKKLVLLLSAMQHHVEALRADGWDAVFVRADTLADGLRAQVDACRPAQVFTMDASEWAGRQWQHTQMQAALGVPVTVVPNTQFLGGQYTPFLDAGPDKPVIFENFYRKMRTHFDVLMQGRDPLTNRWNYDAENRKPLPRHANPPDVPGYAPDTITQAAMAELAQHTPGVGTVEGFDYAVTHRDAAHALDDFIARRLPTFGPYEDAMSAAHHTLWHSVLSPYINIGLLTPQQLIEAAVAAYHNGHAPLASLEGFVRQVIGWREYMWWNYWRMMPGLRTMNAWHATRPMPAFFWEGGHTDMNCLRHVVQRAEATGYTHHIERLMVVTNFCTLAGIDPQAVTDWFKALYIDAYDWVMQTNVVGMGLNADGGIIATKPYISSANYIDKMSDYCKGCRFNPRQRTGDDACPFNALYWTFLLEHEAHLRAHPRLGRNVLGLAHLDDETRHAVRAQAQAFLDGLVGWAGSP